MPVNFNLMEMYDKEPEVSGQKQYYFKGIRSRLISLKSSPAISTSEFIQ